MVYGEYSYVFVREKRERERERERGLGERDYMMDAGVVFWKKKSLRLFFNRNTRLGGSATSSDEKEEDPIILL